LTGDRLSFQKNGTTENTEHTEFKSKPWVKSFFRVFRVFRGFGSLSFLETSERFLYLVVAASVPPVQLSGHWTARFGSLPSPS